MAALREITQRTPARRVRYIDLLRALAITAVVLGHWLAIVVVEDNRGDLTGFSALQELTWAHPLTWLFQVMPVFFLVGGFANAASLTSHRRRGGDTLSWLRQRSARLIPPTTAFLVVLAAGAGLARGLGAPPALIGMAVWLASIPLWFLAAYVTVVLLTPLMHALHRRFGLAVPLVLVGLVAAGDLARLGFDQPLLAEPNHLFAWLAIHQAGFAWYSGELRRGAGLALGAGGLVALVGLTVSGPYPISMVTVPGAELQNASPPTLALLALATTQLGLALLVRDPVERWLHRPRPWLVVVAVNAVILTMFLWHMSAAVLTVGVLYLAGILPTPAVDTPEWLWWRLPWVLLLALVLAALVAIFGRIERRGAPAVVSRPGWLRRGVSVVTSREWLRGGLTIAGCAGVVLGLLEIALAGPDYYGVFGLPTPAVLTFVAGAALLRLARSTTAASTQPASPDQASGDQPSGDQPVRRG